MNFQSCNFEIFYVPHSQKWSVIVKQKGLRLNLPFLIECAPDIKGVAEIIKVFVEANEHTKDVHEQINNYENQNRKGA